MIRRPAAEELMSPKYTVTITRWERYVIDHVEAASEEDAQERGRGEFEELVDDEHTEDAEYISIDARLEEE